MNPIQGKTLKVTEAFSEAFNRATALHSAGNTDAARRAYRKCAQVNPELWFGVGCKAMQDGLRVEAMNIFLDVLEFAQTEQTIALALNNLAFLRMHYGERELAEKYFKQSIDIHPCTANWVNYGILLTWIDRKDEAMSLFERAIQKEPACPGAHFSKAMIMLERGDYAKGWYEYEARFQIQGSSSKKMDGPGVEWDGSNPAGKHLLIYPEQGIGDMIMMMRYAPIIKQRGAEVSLFCQRGLRRLAASMKCFKHIIEAGETLPEFDLKAPAMELARLCGTMSPETIPNAPYIPRKARKPGNTFRVGLCWRGNVSHKQDFMRSCKLEHMRPLFDVDGIEWHSFQVGYGNSELMDSGLPLNSLNLTDYYSTARALDDMDLLISVDTSVVHVAGAMGVPTWLMRAKAGDWRWMRDRTDSPWYPSVRIFRQQEFNDWSQVIADMKSALDKRLNRWS